MLKKLNGKAKQIKGQKGNISQILAATGLLILLGFGVFAQMGWLPNTDNKTGKRNGWFGVEITKNSRSSNWNPFAEAKPQTNLQLSKEYIYAGSRLLAIEEAGGGSGTPTPTPTPPPGSVDIWTDLADGVSVGANGELVMNHTHSVMGVAASHKGRLTAKGSSITFIANIESMKGYDFARHEPISRI